MQVLEEDIPGPPSSFQKDSYTFQRESTYALAKGTGLGIGNWDVLYGD